MKLVFYVHLHCIKYQLTRPICFSCPNVVFCTFLTSKHSTPVSPSHPVTFLEIVEIVGVASLHPSQERHLEALEVSASAFVWSSGETVCGFLGKPCEVGGLKVDTGFPEALGSETGYGLFNLALKSNNPNFDSCFMHLCGLCCVTR